MHLSYNKSGSFVVNGEVKAAEEVNQENTGFFFSIFSAFGTTIAERLKDPIVY